MIRIIVIILLFVLIIIMIIIVVIINTTTKIIIPIYITAMITTGSRTKALLALEDLGSLSFFI